jgi:copper chaperone CopZ
MNRLTVICIAIAVFSAVGVNAQKVNKTETSEKWQKIVLQTNGTCQACKDRIESGIAYEKGVKDVSYELQTAKVTITYNPEKTSVQALKDAIVKLGYKAEVATAEETKNCSKTCPKPCESKAATKPACSGHSH